MSENNSRGARTRMMSNQNGRSVEKIETQQQQPMVVNDDNDGDLGCSVKPVISQPTNARFGVGGGRFEKNQTQQQQPVVVVVVEKPVVNVDADDNDGDLSCSVASVRSQPTNGRFAGGGRFEKIETQQRTVVQKPEVNDDNDDDLSCSVRSVRSQQSNDRFVDDGGGRSDIQ
jgi:hypothetical protein